VKTRFASCSQARQLFLKADGNITCSCSRYYHVLGNADELDAGAFFNGPLMQYIRESFADGYEPFDFCRGCISRTNDKQPARIRADANLHIEPSNNCNLFCSACTCTDERNAVDMPKRRNLDFGTFEKLLRDIARAEIDVVDIAFVGYGEPLFNSRLHDMARLARSTFPRSRIYVDSNGNFGDRRAEELADCGIDEIRIGLDGVDQESYAAYRERGDFNRVLAFTAKLAAAIRAKNSRTRVVWKYILFRHNDRDDQILAAARMADEIGVAIIFDQTVGPLASRRPLAEIQALASTAAIGCNIEPDAATN
jgi:hypothetical protein